MGNYRHDAMLAVVGTVALLPVAMLPILAHVVRRFGALRGWPMIAAMGLLGSAISLAAFTVFPMPDPGTLRCTAADATATWRTHPFAFIALMRSDLHAHGFPAFLGTPWSLQVIFNVLLFVPYGFFLHQVTRWTGLSVAFFALFTSGTIEIMQGTGMFGLYACPYRTLEVDDVILNTTGAILGVIVSYAAIRLFHWTTPPPDPDLGKPTLARRSIAATLDLALVLVLDFVIQAVGVVYAALTDGRATHLNNFETPIPSSVSDVIAVVLLMLIVPLIRRDSATPGQVVVNIAPTRSSTSARPAHAWQVLVRACVRWAPMVIFQAWGIIAVVIVEVVTTLARADQRSLSGVAAHTVTRTNPAIRATIVDRPAYADDAVW